MSACGQAAKQEPIVSASTELHQVDLVSAGTLVFDLASVPAYSGQPYAIVNDNKPYFTDALLSASDLFQLMHRLHHIYPVNPGHYMFQKKLPSDQRL